MSSITRKNNLGWPDEGDDWRLGNRWRWWRWRITIDERFARVVWMCNVCRFCKKKETLLQSWTISFHAMYMKCIFHFVLLPKKEEAGRLCREKLAENEEAVSQGARGRAGGRRLWLRAACHGLHYVFLHSFLKTQSQTRCFFTTFTTKNWNFEVVYPVFETSIWYWKDLWIYDIWERASYICILYTYICTFAYVYVQYVA